MAGLADPFCEFQDQASLTRARSAQFSDAILLMICSLARLRLTSKPEGWWIELWRGRPAGQLSEKVRAYP